MIIIVTAVYSYGRRITICLGKSCSFGLLCVSFVNIYPFVYVCVCVSLLVLRVGCGS